MAIDDGEVPLPDDTSARDSTRKADLKDILDIQKEILRGQEASKEEERSIEWLTARRVEQLKEITQKMVGLKGVQKEQAKEVRDMVEDQKKSIEATEQYFGVIKGTTQKLREAKDTWDSIERVVKALNLSQAEADKAHALAERDERSRATIKSMGGMMQAVGQAKDLGDTIFNYQFQNAMIAAIGKSATLMQGANYKGGLGGQALSNQMFGGTGIAMSPVEKMDALNKVLANAPKAASESTASMNKMIGTMAFFGADIAKVTETLIAGNKNLNLSADELASTYMSANAISKDLGLSTLETADNLLTMYTSLRQVGGSVHQAESLLSSFSKMVSKTGLSAIEAAGLAEKFTQGISSLPLEKMMGLVQYTTGRGITQQTAADLGGGNVMGTFSKTFDRISSQMGNSYGEQLIATEKVAQLFGINVSNFRDVSNLMKMMQEHRLDDHAIDLLSNPALVAAKGIEDLKATIDPITRIANYTQSIQSIISTWSAAVIGLSAIVPALAALKFGASAIGGASKLATTVAEGALGAEAAEVAGTGIAMATGVGEVALVLGTGAAIGAGGYQAWKHRKEWGLSR